MNLLFKSSCKNQRILISAVLGDFAHRIICNTELFVCEGQSEVGEIFAGRGVQNRLKQCGQITSADFNRIGNILYGDILCIMFPDELFRSTHIIILLIAAKYRSICGEIM